MNGIRGSETARILVVDDTAQNLQLLTDILTSRGYEVRAAQDGRAALDDAHSDPPDLILLDIMMPGLTGYQVCERLKSDSATQDIPVIFISALGETLDKVHAFSVGAVDYITKPFSVEEVLARVENHLNLKIMQEQLQSRNARLRREIAERKRAEAELQQQTSELKARNDELDAFAHTVAHNLQGTLSVIVTYAELLQEEQLTQDEREKGLASILRSGKKMVRIIQNLLMLAELRKTGAVMHPVDMKQPVAEALERVDRMADASHAIIELPKAWPCCVGYGPWVEEVWVNYLSNGIKYGGRPPRLVLGSTALPDGRVKYWIKDNGSGLTSQQMAQLFTPFNRLNQVKIKGYGLGLSIVRRIVERMNGEVGVESAQGEGSTFYFTLRGTH